MKRSIIVCMCALLVCAAPVKGGVWDKMKTMFGFHDQPKILSIKVLVAKEVKALSLEVTGKYNIYDPFLGSRLGTRYLGKSATIESVSDGIRWGEVFPGVYQIVIVPDSPATTTIINGVEYKGSVFVYQVEGSLDIVNEVPVEDYVNSILSTQFTGGTPDEALAALAIAARTDACHAALKYKDRFWHVEANKVGYEGHAVTSRDSGIAEVMQSTRNLVLSRTRAFDGTVTPFRTHCLETEYGESKHSSWSLDQAEALAHKGENAAQILNAFFPETTVEMMSSFDHAALGSSPNRAIADAAP